MSLAQVLHESILNDLLARCQKNGRLHLAIRRLYPLCIYCFVKGNSRRSTERKRGVFTRFPRARNRVRPQEVAPNANEVFLHGRSKQAFQLFALTQQCDFVNADASNLCVHETWKMRPASTDATGTFHVDITVPRVDSTRNIFMSLGILLVAVNGYG